MAKKQSDDKVIYKLKTFLFGLKQRQEVRLIKSF